MPSLEGPSERHTGEVVETDLTRIEGLPSQRGHSVDEGGIGRLQDSQNEGAMTEISAAFTGPWKTSFNGSLRNRSTETSPLNRSVAALLPAVLGTLVAVLFGWIFLDSTVPDDVVFGGTLIIIVVSFTLGGYLSHRASSEPRAPSSRDLRTPPENEDGGSPAS